MIEPPFDIEGRNAYRLRGDGAVEIALTQGRTALVDFQDVLVIAGFRWYASTADGHWYAAANAKRPDGRPTIVRMHRLLMPHAQYVDHINHDGLDNRRTNLRAATNQDNSANAVRSRRNTSGYKGVIFVRRIGKWHARIKRDGRYRHLGYFSAAEDAARAYDAAARALFGPFANPNFPLVGEST